MMQNQYLLDEMRRRTQAALIQSKRKLLQDKFGLEFDYVNEEMPPEVENEWLDFVLEFERQFAHAQTITIRERIGDPPLPSLSELPGYAIAAATESLLSLLQSCGISVEFLGDWEDVSAYRYLLEELLDEEIEDIQIDGMRAVFTPSTVEYDVQMWVESFVIDVFVQDRTYFFAGLEKQPIFDELGKPMSPNLFKEKLERVWRYMAPTTEVAIDAMEVDVEGNDGRVTAVVIWPNGAGHHQVVSTFRLQPSPYTGWDVVQTSLLDDLLAQFCAS